jgi:DNA-binding CsgD family transcriptional regulator
VKNVDRNRCSPVLRRPLPAARREKVYELWDALAEYPSFEADAALERLMKSLCEWTGADNAFWVGGVRMASGEAAKRDGQYGWRARVVRHLTPPTPEVVVRIGQGLRGQDSDPGMTTRAITAQAGAFRVRRLRDGFVDFAALRQTAHYHTFYRAHRIVDRMWAVFPVNGDAESYFMFDHIASSRRFSAADVALIAYAMRGIKWFHRQLLLSHGLLVAQTPLSPAQRRVLLLLLTGESEKDLAAAAKLTRATIHQYVVELYQKFGVNSRPALMALWLGR